jgi:hypothetical protein
MRNVSALFAIFFLAFCLKCSVFAQDKKTPKEYGSFKEHLFTGGSIGLNIGTITLIEASPMLGYRFNDYLAAGLGFTYQYYRDNSYKPAISTDIYGGRVFARVYPIEKAFLHVEYEVLSLKTDVFDYLNMYPNTTRFTFTSLFGGGGYREPISDKSYAYIMLLYNFNDSMNSPYGNPFVLRMGVEIGL